MKYIKNFAIFEAKQVGILYHYTSVVSLMKILKSGELLGSLEYGNKFISFTRDKNFLKHPMRTIKDDAVRIVLDGDKLSNKYKIQPFNYQYRFATRYDDAESEERIYIDKISNIKNYIIRIEFTREPSEYAIEVMNKYNFDWSGIKII
jgi:hypothetical protein